MSILGFLPVIDKVLDKVFPDKAKRDEIKLKMLELEQAGQFKNIDALVASDAGQTAISVEEAKSESLFKSGWRPMAGWVCVSALLYAGLGKALLTWGCLYFEVPPPPAIDTTELVTMLFGLLGLGAYRSHDKKHGVS